MVCNVRIKKNMKYFGRYPVFNILASKFFFWSLKRRRRKLASKNAAKYRNAEQFTWENKDQSAQEFKTFLDRGLSKASIGGGFKNLEGYINIDFEKHDGVSHEVIANINDLSFIPDACLTHIHSNHVVEHITKDDFRNLLSSAKRILKPDGVMTLRCPNVLGVSYGFFHGAVSESDHEEFVKLGFPADEEFANPLDNWYEEDLYAYVHWVWGDVGNPANQHLAYWTPSAMKNVLKGSGFEVLKMSDPECSNLVVVAKPVV